MNKRSSILSEILAGLVALCALSAGARAAEFEAIVPPQPTADPAKVEVVEVFWYACPHCYRLLPHIERWAHNKAEKVNDKRMPAILNANWAFHARAYFTGEALGAVKEIHRPLFDAIRPIVQGTPRTAQRGPRTQA